MLLYCHAKIQSRKEGKNICLNECNKQLKQAHEYCKRDGKTKADTYSEECVYIPENKDQTDKSQDDGMPGCNIRKETNHQYKWLGKYPNDLNNRH